MTKLAQQEKYYNTISLITSFYNPKIRKQIRSTRPKTY